MCGKHNDHIHSTEKKHSGREEQRERKQAQMPIQKTVSPEKYIYIIHTVF